MGISIFQSDMSRFPAWRGKILLLQVARVRDIKEIVLGVFPPRGEGTDGLSSGIL